MQRNVQLKPIRLDSSMAIKMSMGGSMFQERALMARSDVWHMIKILKGAHCNKEEVLNAILAAVEPAELIPMKYQITGNEDSYFIARNCAAALDKLCKCNLIIKNGNNDPFILVITLAYALAHDLKLNMQPALSNVLAKRFGAKNRALDLSEFHRDPGLASVVYCPLSQTKMFAHVLNFAKSSASNFEMLILQRNDLISLAALETSNITSIKSLDLRQNNLLNMSVLAALRNMGITKLWLDGNPLCENYSSPSKYIESARKYCPNLVQLDGVSLKTSGPPQPCVSFARNERVEGLVRKFAVHFFTLFDQGDRTGLRGLYCKSSIHSMSFGIPGGVAPKLGLSQYTASRNLMRAETKKSQKQGPKQMQHIYQGEGNILTAFKKIPRCYHEKNTFTYDVMYEDEKCLAFSIGGYVKKVDSPAVVLSFNRTFVLIAKPENEYQIMNDQYHVDAAPESMGPNSIQMTISYDPFKPTCFSEQERRELILKFVEVSTMNKEWCQSYLDDAKWNLRNAIKTFMEDYETSNIPQHAFTR